MRKGSICVVLALVAVSFDLRANDLFTGLLAASARADASLAEAQVDQFVAKLDSRDNTQDVRFLKKLFRKTHQQFLRNYVVYSDFGDLFQNGNYDCLTATALFATLLDRFGYGYSIYETNYHIFLLVNTCDGEVLIESTDPVYGLETDKVEIQKRMQSYRQANTGQEGSYAYKQETFKALEKSKLSGLLLFNQAVTAFNNQDMLSAAEKLLKAHHIYHADRNVELAALIVQAASALKLENDKQIQIQHMLLTLLAGESYVSR